MADAELLTTDDDGRVVEGPRIPITGAAAKYRSEDDDVRIAPLYTFFRRDATGAPVPGTEVRFFVPAHLVNDGAPTRRALELVSRRMGWWT